jgi:hypothetical protein
MLADEDGRTNRPAPLLGAADRSPPVTSRLLLLQVQVQLQVLVGAAAAGVLLDRSHRRRVRTGWAKHT